MKKVVQRFLNGLLGIITTFLIMAAPVAAIVYAADQVNTTSNYSIEAQVFPNTDSRHELSLQDNQPGHSHQTASTPDARRR